MHFEQRFRRRRRKMWEKNRRQRFCEAVKAAEGGDRRHRRYREVILGRYEREKGRLGK